jgi:methylenetetrahydrofolate dehydrogenase (NADP+)/methenyltetrahydrofolate cyclohydrolase
MFRPLPKELDNERARNAIVPEKDIDGCSDASLAGVFTGNGTGFAPCTAEAAVAVLDHYGIELTGKRAVVLGRSLVVGRPLAMLLMSRNATVTICHTRTKDMPSIAREADILFTCMGQAEMVDASYVREGQTVVDISICWNEAKGKLCGDCLFDAVEPAAERITPVPGGVGAVTTAVLVRHLAEAAERKTK